MTFRILDAGTLRTISSGQVKVAGVMRPLRFIKVMDGGSLRTVATFVAPLSASTSDTSGFGNGTEGATVITSTASAVVSGGLAPFTYAWALLTNGGGTASTATAPASATTAFSKSGMPGEAFYQDTWRVTVTDSLGSTATADLTATFVNVNTGSNL